MATTIHELGHYLAGMAFRVKMKSFNIFWGPGFKIFSSHYAWFLRLFPSCKDKIEVTVGWLPILNYVVFTSPQDTVEKDSCLWNKPAWQRFIVYISGVMMNLLTVFIITFSLLFHKAQNPSVCELIESSARITYCEVRGMSIGVAHDATNFCKKICGIDIPKTRLQKTAEATGRGEYYIAVSSIHSEWNWIRLAFILESMSIAFFCINLIPIPPLDGGNLLYCIIEMVTNKRPPMNVQIWINGIVFILFMLYMAYDILREIIMDIF